MFKRFFYKLHLSDRLRIARSDSSQELINISLLIILVLLGSLFFASRGIASAENNQPIYKLTSASTYYAEPLIAQTTSTNQQTNVGTSQDPTTINSQAAEEGTLKVNEVINSDRILKYLYTYYDTVQPIPIETENSGEPNRELCYVPRQKGEFVAREYWNATGGFVNCYRGKFTVKTTIDKSPDQFEKIIGLQIKLTVPTDFIVTTIKQLPTSGDGDNATFKLADLKKALQVKSTTCADFQKFSVIKGNSNDNSIPQQFSINAMLNTKSPVSSIDPLANYSGGLFSSGDMKSPCSNVTFSTPEELKKYMDASTVMDAISTLIQALTNNSNKVKATGDKEAILTLPDSEILAYDIIKATTDGGWVVMNSGPIVFNVKNGLKILATGNEAFLRNTDVLSTTSKETCSNQNLPYYSQSYQCVDVYVNKVINNRPAYAINPYVMGKRDGGDTFMVSTGPRAFSSESIARYWISTNNSYANVLINKHSISNYRKDGTRKTQDELYGDLAVELSRNANNDPGLIYLNTAFYETKTSPPYYGTGNECYAYYLDNGEGPDCDKTSAEDKFTRGSQQYDFSFGGAYGYPSGNASKWLTSLYKFNTFSSEYNLNTLSYKNTYPGDFKVKIDMELTKCALKGGCAGGAKSNLTVSDITGKFYCMGCGFMNKDESNAAVVSQLDTTPGSKAKVVKGLYTYATNSRTVYGYSSIGTDNLSRFYNGSTGIAHNVNYYNVSNIVNIAFDGRELPLNSSLDYSLNEELLKVTPNTEIGKKSIIYNPIAQTSGGVNASQLNSDEFYGMTQIGDEIVAYRAKGVDDISNFQTAAFNLSKFSNNPNLSKNFGGPKWPVPISARARPATATSVVLQKNCQTTSNETKSLGEILHVTFHLYTEDPIALKSSDPDADAKSQIFYMRSKLPQVEFCNQYIDTFTSIKSANNWTEPIIISPNSVFVTQPYNSNYSMNGETQMMVLNYARDNSDSPWQVEMRYATVDSEATHWYSTDGSEVTPVNFNYDLTKASNLSYKFDTRDIPGGAPSFAGAIGANGTKYLLMAGANNSDKVVLYTWDTPFPVNPKKIIYNLSSYSTFGLKQPKSLNVASIDVNPVDGRIAFGINMNYVDAVVKNRDFSTNTTSDKLINYTIPVIMEQDIRTKNKDFVVYIMDQNMLQEVYEDTTAWLLNPDSKDATVNPEIKQVKFLNNGQLNGYMSMMKPYFSKVVNIKRDSSTEKVYPCVTGEFNGSYTRFFNSGLIDPSKAGQPVCDGFNSSSIPVVTKSPVFGDILSINDDDYYDKYIGKLAADKLNDFSMPPSSETAKAPIIKNPLSYKPLAPSDKSSNGSTELFERYFGVKASTLGKDPANYSSPSYQKLIDDYKNNKNNTKDWFNILWPKAVEISQSEEFKGKIDPEVVMVWLYGETTLNPFAENCKDSLDYNTHFNVNRIKYPCDLKGGGIWQNAGYQMTDHGESEYKKAFETYHKNENLFDVANTVIDYSIKYTPTDISKYQNISEDALPGGKFPAKYKTINDLFADCPLGDGSGIRTMSDKCRLYIALIGKDPYTALYLNTMTISNKNNLHYDDNYYAPKNWINYFYATYQIAMDNYYQNDYSNQPSATGVINPTNLGLCGDKKGLTCLNALGIYRDLGSITSQSYDEAITYMSKKYDIPKELFIAIKVLESGSRDVWMTDTKYVQASLETQIGSLQSLIDKGLLNNTGSSMDLSSIMMGKNNNVTSPACPRNFNNNSSIDLGPLQINYPNTYNGVNNIRSKISDLFNGSRTYAGTNNKVSSSELGNPCDFYDNLAMSAEVILSKKATCDQNLPSKAWNYDMVYCVMAAYNGAQILNTAKTETIEVNGRMTQVNIKVEGLYKYYPVLGLKIYGAYGGK
ncbi:MAG: hypothetical protein WCJ19_01485 [bacterium]